MANKRINLNNPISESIEFRNEIVAQITMVSPTSKECKSLVDKLDEINELIRLKITSTNIILDNG